MTTCGQGWNLQEDNPIPHRALPSGAKDGLRDESPPLETPQNYALNAKVIHKASNPHKHQFRLVCNSPTKMRGPYGPSAPWLHVKIACNVWIDTLDSPSN